MSQRKLDKEFARKRRNAERAEQKRQRSVSRKQQKSAVKETAKNAEEKQQWHSE